MITKGPMPAVTDGRSVEEVAEEIVDALGLERRALRNEDFGPGQQSEGPVEPVEPSSPPSAVTPVIGHSGNLYQFGLKPVSRLFGPHSTQCWSMDCQWYCRIGKGLKDSRADRYHSR